ncbi:MULTISPECIES: hypothetical protein [Paraburkholderia]|uniref:hypothetical protein n=1 Tax=Paraburkholderia TaxID=1822464 RepID=UPI002254A427|nr:MULTISPECIES: hypothetical protein [Paraburkholderia]MCX4161872.1 hypothetical protein [Paraburkholderia megapolitana]MDN7157369.1 hypothetical protein [Paraburkholderia sp. CHISQ3]MDQ6494414.1 hypothetical protein [Paraburkholderia megapolitana]
MSGWLGWIACGVATIAVTLGLMAWLAPAQSSGIVAAVTRATTQPRPVETGQSAAPVAPSLPVSQGPTAGSPVDMLARLEAARSNAAFQPGGIASDTMADALQHAFSYPNFSALENRADAEGLFEAAAWADACVRGTLSANEQSLRCSDTRLRDAKYADDLLHKAAAAGQPAAVLALANLYPAEWLNVPLAGSDTLGDRVLTLAAHGNASALALLSQWCASPKACTDAQLTRNTLALLQVSLFKTGTSEVNQYLIGKTDEQQAAISRADSLRKLLGWPS